MLLIEVQILLLYYALLSFNLSVFIIALNLFHDNVRFSDFLFTFTEVFPYPPKGGKTG